MHVDYRIPKPASLRGYMLHRMVTSLTDGHPAMFADEGKTLVVRTEYEIDAPSTPVKKFNDGDMTAFELCACVSKKRKGKHIYLPIADWRSRRAWLALQGEKHGFEPLTHHSSSKMVEINDGRRVFKVDQTDFTGVLKVTDADKFHHALTTGVGSTARTFGFGMLIVE
jgi:CRISPR-associated protein Cas6/Cse3/CasE subtype I-E